MTDTTLPVPLPEPIDMDDDSGEGGRGGAIWHTTETLAAYTRACMAPLQERADALQAEVDSLRRAEKWGVKDLRERIWLDPECAEDGCQSIRFKARADALQTELNSIADTLPGVHYMDPPDGGAPTLVEQFKRMAKDARRADALEEALSHFAAIDLKRADVPADFAWHVLNARSLINPTGGES